MTPEALSLYATLVQIVHDPGVVSVLLVPLILIPLDLITGITLAVRQHRFALRRITDFVGKDLWKYLGMLGFILMIWILSGEMTATAFASLLGMGSLSISIGASILENISSLNLPPAVLQEASHLVKDLEAIAQTPPSSPPANAPHEAEEPTTIPTPAVIPVGKDAANSPYTKFLSAFTDQITAPMPAIRPEAKTPSLILRPSPTSFLSYAHTQKELIL